MSTISQREFTFEERIGLLFTVEAATLSICAVTIILCYALFKWLLTWRKNDPDESDASDSILFLNLMLADLIQGLGTMPNIKWLNDGHITEGELCTAQAALKQVGIVGVAMTSLAIALYTYIVLVWRKDRTIPKHTGKGIVAAIWIFVAIVDGIPNAAFRKVKYYGATIHWCWILPTHQAEQIVTEYLWVWFTALSMLLLYPIMFFRMRRSVMKDEHRVQTEDIDLDRGGQLESAEDQQPNETGKTKKVAQQMLYYPFIYIVCTIPNSVSRWMSFKGHTPTSKFTFAANTLFALSGLFNFVLFFITRPVWVCGNRQQGEKPQRPASQHGLPPPENQEHASTSRRQDSGSRSSAVQPHSGIYNPTFLSPTSQGSRSLPPENRITSNPSYGDEDYGSLAPRRR